MKPSPKIASILEFCTVNNIEIVSYGLAPNPNGFCYELPEECDGTDAGNILHILLDSLTSAEERELRKLVF